MQRKKGETDDKEESLYQLVKTHMVHGPCGKDNPGAPCMKTIDGELKCEKGYPKPFQEKTIIDEFGRVHYKRPNNGRTVKVWCAKRQMHFNLSNQWIVPYNIALLTKYKSHVNVEIVNSAENHIKYMFKYFTKGPDRCLVQRKDGSLVTDELSHYQDSRYIGATEACWRIQEFPLRFRYPPVETLAIHLEDQQNIIFKDSKLTKEEIRQIANSNQTSQLTKFFKLNQDKPTEAGDYTYDHILRHFRWDKSKKEFIKRTQKLSKNIDANGEDDAAKSNQIGRMPVISLNPHTKELFFLRVLLHHVKGPKSFEHLRTVDGHVYDTNQDACIALGLFEDDKTIEQAFVEGASFRISESALLHLFVTLCIYAMPSNPLALWEKYKGDLCSWRMKQENVDEPTPEIINDILLQLRALFQDHGKNMSSDEFKLPEPSGELTKEKREVALELDYDCQELAQVADENESKLNEQQLTVYNAIKEAVNNETGELIGLQASGTL